MGRRGQIFERAALRPSQLRTVAARRFADAEYLYESGRNERANGAMYLAGFVIECLLKAKLFEKHNWVKNSTFPRDRSTEEQRVWSLCWRSHDLDELLAHLPEVSKRAAELERQGYPRVIQFLKSICAEWTIFARYSPYSATIKEAEEFVTKVKELKEWLK